MQGNYFWKKRWEGTPVPRWEDARELLPEPVLDNRPEALEAFHAAWRGCLAGLRSPTPSNGFVSNYLFMPFNDCIFAHDTAVMMLFARYGTRVFDPAESFDNFYAAKTSGACCQGW